MAVRTGMMWRLILWFVGVVSAAVPVLGLPVPITGSSGVLVYLTRYGYLSPTVSSEKEALRSMDYLTEGIRNFQVFAGLEVTGELDEATLELMRTPRCGVQDNVGYGSSDDARRKRYVLQGSRWKRKDLTYRISKYPSGLKKEDVNKVITSAFKVWSDVADLTFKQMSSGRAHIDIRFEKYAHGDGDPFDGRGGTLAHAYFPIYGGDAHFDDSERWTIASYSGVNLFQTASHEFGHSLGLSHSDVNAALMAPFYRGYDPNSALDDDDIQGIQALYGKKTVPPTTQPPSGSGGSGSGSGGSGSGSGGSGSGSGGSGSGSGDSGSSTGDSGSGSGDSGSGTEASGSGSCGPDGATESCLCKNGSIDTIVTTMDGNTYVFKGDLYWLLNEVSVEEGYPRNISNDWKGLPNNIDAAFTWARSKTFFFKGSKYWRFTNMKMDAGYPKKIKDGFEGIPDDIDTAFVRSRSKIYFFQGTQYWRYDTPLWPHVSEAYPKKTTVWQGLPSTLDGSLRFSGETTYFFKGGEYWRFNNRRFRVDNANPPYPRPTGQWWFGCQAQSSMTAGVRNNQGIVSFSDDGNHSDDHFDAAYWRRLNTPDTTCTYKNIRPVPNGTPLDRLSPTTARVRLDLANLYTHTTD